MVGIFGGKNAPSRPPHPGATTPVHSTPPPPYVDNAQSGPLYATETTTTTTHVVTTTHTTTHFFSIPLWRKRTPASSAADLNRPRLHASPSLGELGIMYSDSRPPTVLLRDKDLPPTPSPSDSPDRTPADTPGPSSSLVLPGNSSQTSINGSGPSRLSASPMAFSHSEGGEPSQSATLLARAALGLGLQPAMLSQLASSSNMDLNSVSFVTPPTPETHASKPILAMRRAKSFQKDPSDIGGEQVHAELMERRRSRGLSLGPIHFGTDNKGKGKEKEPDPEARPSFQKSLARKASFWSRKRYDSQTKPPPDLNFPPGPERNLQPSLPNLQPISPFRMDTPAPAPAPPTLTPEYSSSSLPSPELRRRHSERGHQNVTSQQVDDVTAPETSPTESKFKRRRPRRPQTADTADSHRRRSSSLLHTAPPPLSSSPPSTQLSSSPPTSLSSVSNQSTVRPRASTNPPFLQRLSINLFGSPSISSPHPASPAPTPSSDQLVESPLSSLPGSARPSISRSKHSLEIPRPRQEEESPELYLQRLLEAVSKAEVATVLASSPDEFHARALRSYIERFDFSSDPLDVALRKLLMDVGLPKETQQIDRVMEAFAARYRQCHANLFTSDDHPYILAFSLIMLHTDAFNKSNKRKMSKADYVKNTRLPGVAPEVLDCFYDNIVFAPFIFIEDPLDVNGQRGLLPDGTPNRRMSTFNASSPGGVNGSGSSLLGKGGKIDPYYLITRNLLDDLRVNVQAFVPLRSPYVYQGTGGQWDDDELLRAFQTAGVVEINSTGYYPAPWFSLSVGGGPGPMTLGGTVPPPYPESPETFTLRVTKVGALWRKDEALEGGRKPMNRKWREWSVLLTGSQLLLCRDLTWANLIQAKVERANGEASLSYASIPKPDELLSVKDTVAVYDKSYSKYRNVLRLIMPDGRQVLFQAPDEVQMNEWIARINYASAFKTAGVRMRSLGMSGKDIELTGKAAAASHLRDVQNRNRQPATPRVRTWGGRSSLEIELPSRNGREPTAEQDPILGRVSTRTESVDSDSFTSPMENPSKLFKATFDQVKEDLAAGRWQAVDEGSLRTFRPRAMSLESSLHSPPASSSSVMVDEIDQVQMSSRSRIIRSKISELETKLSVAQSQLDTDMRFVFNIAVLTPFQRATRERLQTAVQTVSKRIMQVRLDIEKLRCHRDVLARDLVAEERDWQRTKKMALRAATLTLQHHDIQPVPRMTLSVFLDDVEQSIPRTESPTPSPMALHRPESSAAESFHSALDYNSDYDDLRDTSMDTSRSPTTPSTPKHAGMSLSAEVDPQDRLLATPLTTESSLDSSSSNRSVNNEHGHSKYVTAPEIPEEEAEEWNKTRAAKRVSLVKLPSDIRMSVLFGKHEQNHREVIPEDCNINPSPPRSKHAF